MNSNRTYKITSNPALGMYRTHLYQGETEVESLPSFNEDAAKAFGEDWINEQPKPARDLSDFVSNEDPGHGWYAPNQTVAPMPEPVGETEVVSDGSYEAGWGEEPNHITVKVELETGNTKMNTDQHTFTMTENSRQEIDGLTIRIAVNNRYNTLTVFGWNDHDLPPGFTGDAEIEITQIDIDPEQDSSEYTFTLPSVEILAALADWNEMFGSARRAAEAEEDEMDDMAYEVEMAEQNIMQTMEIDRKALNKIYDDLYQTMTASEVAAEFGLSEIGVRKAIERHTLPARKSAGTWLIRRADAEARWGKK